MAKYRLEKNRKKSVNCEVLCENLNGYIVRFDNGMIKNVKKSNVYALDRIDEAVLDDVRGGIKKFGRRVADIGRRVVDNVVKFFRNAFVVDGFVFFGDKKNGVVNASSPLNIMSGAIQSNCVNYVPSTDVINQCSEYGIDAQAVENYQMSGRYEGAVQFNSSITESAKSNFIESLVEEANPDRWLSHDQRVNLQGDFGDWTQNQIIDFIISEYESRYNDEKYDGLPLMIWGAPGIGKTAILRSFADFLADDLGGKRVNIVSVNGGNVGPDDFTMPAEIQQKIVEYSKGMNSTDVNTRRVSMSVIKDIPKLWLPVYDNTGKSGDPGALNVIANGGEVEYEYDADGNIIGYDVIDEGVGGIFFIDEYSRLSLAGMDALMQTPTSRNIGSNSTLTFGSKWIIVCAANRIGDMNREMGERDALVFEAASKTRFTHVNFIPEPEMWLEWARENTKGRSTGQNVLPHICNYIETQVSKKNMGDYYEMYNHADGMLNKDYGTACPRTWEAYSEVIRTNLLKRTTGVSFKRKSQQTYASVSDIPEDDLFRFGEAIVGGDPTKRFCNYVANDTFTDEDAEEVFTKADKADYIVSGRCKALNSANYQQRYKSMLPKLKIAAEKFKQRYGALYILSPDALYNLYLFAEAVSTENGRFNKNMFNRLCAEFDKAMGMQGSFKDEIDIYADALKLHAEIVS